jgi:hypothetical protein
MVWRRPRHGSWFFPALTALLLGTAAGSAMAQSGGDVFSTNTDEAPAGGTAGGDETGAGGLPGEPAIDTYGRDAECGGTNRSYYDKMYGTKAEVVSPEEAQRQYSQNQVQRCAACGTDKVICWPKQGTLLLQGGVQNDAAPDQPLTGGTSQGVPRQGTLLLQGGVQNDAAPDQPLTGGTSYGAPQMVGRKKGTCWVAVHGAREPVFVWIMNSHKAGDVVSGPTADKRSIVWVQGTVLSGNRFRCTVVRDARGRQFAVNAVATLTPE